MLFVFSMVVMPVNALTLDGLDIYVTESGDAVVTIEYILSFLERITVFLGMTDPAKEIQRAVADNLGKEVSVFAVERVVYKTKAQDGPYSQSFSNMDDNIIYVPKPSEDIIKGNDMVLRLGIKQFSTVERFSITNENITLKSDPVPGAEIYIEQEPYVRPQSKKESTAGGEQGGRGSPVVGFWGEVYTTPKLSFAEAEEAFNQLWFAPLINMDFSPRKTRITFPRGDSITFSNQISIPAFNYTVKATAIGNRAGFAVGGYSLS
jgi:hypothetical protein